MTGRSQEGMEALVPASEGPGPAGTWIWDFQAPPPPSSLPGPHVCVGFTSRPEWRSVSGVFLSP